MPQEEHSAYSYLRQTKKFPNVWCSGCGIGVVMGALIRAVDRIGLAKDDVAVVSGIGCTGRMPVYLDFNTMHTTHGRALAFATGLKLAQPKLKVIVVMGDGDALAIGGNHFIHAARRNIDLTAIIVNNSVYGMTGGQYSPTTPLDLRATTAPYGNIEQAIRKNGFSLIEAVSYCHTTFGRINKLGTAVEMMRQLKDNSITRAAADKLTPEQHGGKIVRGVLCDLDKPEYTALYDQVIERARAGANGQPRTAGGL